MLLLCLLIMLAHKLKNAQLGNSIAIIHVSGCGFACIISTSPSCPMKWGRKGKELWKEKLVHLLPSGGLVTTAPTIIQSTTPIKQKMAATTITMMCHHFILSKRGKNIKVMLHISRVEWVWKQWVLYTCNHHEKSTRNSNGVHTC